MSTVAENRSGLYDSRRSTGDTPLDGVRRALAALTAPKLHALRAVALEPTAVAPRLMLWLEHAIAWELDRRVGCGYDLHGPVEAIDPNAVSSSMLALAALSRRFSCEHPEVQRLFSAVSASLDLGYVLH
ncbi:MAG: hypothetical protein ABIS17_16730 [Casimicrobiaceae bacterium]